MDGRPALTALADNVSVTAVMSSATDHRRHSCITARVALTMPESGEQGPSGTSENRDKPGIQGPAARPLRLPLDQFR
jgi:hypothetical protein